MNELTAEELECKLDTDDATKHNHRRIPGRAYREGVEAMRKRVVAILEDLQEQGRIDYPSEVFKRVDRAAKKISQLAPEAPRASEPKP